MLVSVLTKATVHENSTLCMRDMKRKTPTHKPPSWETFQGNCNCGYYPQLQF